MSDEKEKWNSIDELLEEINAVHFIEVPYRDKLIRLAWKEVAESIPLGLETETPYDDMSDKEQKKFALELMMAEAYARITAAGKQEGCFNDNVITSEQWAGLPMRVRTIISNEVLEFTKLLEQRF